MFYLPEMTNLMIDGDDEITTEPIGSEDLKSIVGGACAGGTRQP
jgi:hypothetical protein